MTSRTIIIGDLQGCHQEAVALLKKCQATPHDRVIFTGDLIDRGPDNDRCVELAMQMEQQQGAAASVLGNHEAKHLTYCDREARGEDPNVRAVSHLATRQQLTPMHYDYMRTMPLYIRLPEHNAVVVHAGVYPGRPIEAQTAAHLLHIQMINPPGETTKWPSKAPADWQFWTQFYGGPELVIFGHTVFDRPLVADNLVGIDGGACFGRALHAFVLPEREVVSVTAPNDFGKGSRGREAVPLKLFAVHGDINTYS